MRRLAQARGQVGTRRVKRLMLAIGPQETAGDVIDHTLVGYVRGCAVLAVVSAQLFPVEAPRLHRTMGVTSAQGRPGGPSLAWASPFDESNPTAGTCPPKGRSPHDAGSGQMGPPRGTRRTRTRARLPR